MAKTHLKLVTPAIQKRAVAPRRRPNSEFRSVPPVELGYRFAISDELLKTSFRALDHIVFRYDTIASTKCGLPTMNRFTSVFFRGDFAPSTV
jgi:hypothetical protein